MYLRQSVDFVEYFVFAEMIVGDINKTCYLGAGASYQSAICRCYFISSIPDDLVDIDIRIKGSVIGEADFVESGNSTLDY